MVLEYIDDPRKVFDSWILLKSLWSKVMSSYLPIKTPIYDIYYLFFFCLQHPSSHSAYCGSSLCSKVVVLYDDTITVAFVLMAMDSGLYVEKIHLNWYMLTTGLNVAFVTANDSR